MDNSNHGYIYGFAVSIVNEIEKLFGKDLMKELYFKANFKKVLIALEKYATDEEIIQFFWTLEFFYVTNNYVIDKDLKINGESLDECTDKNMWV